MAESGQITLTRGIRAKHCEKDREARGHAIASIGDPPSQQAHLAAVGRRPIVVGQRRKSESPVKHATNDNQIGIGHNASDLFAVSLVSLFAPALVIAGGYGAVLVWLWASGSGGSALARLALAVMFVGVPLVVAHAALRAFTIQLKPLPHALLLSPGFPWAEAREIPYSVIERIAVIRGLGGRIAGSGTLVFHIAGGTRMSVCDLKHPQEAREAIAAAAKAHADRQVARTRGAANGPHGASLSAKS